MLTSALGAMVLAHSLRDKGAKAKIVVLVTLDSLSADTITELKVRARQLFYSSWSADLIRLSSTKLSQSTESLTRVLRTSMSWNDPTWYQPSPKLSYGGKHSTV